MHLTSHKILLLQLAHTPAKPMKSLQKNAKVPLSTAGKTSSYEGTTPFGTTKQQTKTQISCWGSQERRKSLNKGKGKDKIHPRTGHEGPEVEYSYSSTLSLTSALDGVGGQRHTPAALPPGKTRYPLHRRLGRH